MVYVVVKVVKGRRYLYAQKSKREGKKVRTKSWCLGVFGAIGDFVEANFKGEAGLLAAERAQANLEKRVLRLARQSRTEAVRRTGGVTGRHQGESCAKTAVEVLSPQSAILPERHVQASEESDGGGPSPPSTPA